MGEGMCSNPGIMGPYSLAACFQVRAHVAIGFYDLFINRQNTYYTQKIEQGLSILCASGFVRFCHTSL